MLGITVDSKLEGKKGLEEETLKFEIDLLLSVFTLDCEGFGPVLCGFVVKSATVRDQLVCDMVTDKHSAIIEKGEVIDGPGFTANFSTKLNDNFIAN